ncbi:hypothetical protein CTA2_11118, partial [Colletotrichum tanaceti]
PEKTVFVTLPPATVTVTATVLPAQNAGLSNGEANRNGASGGGVNSGVSSGEGGGRQFQQPSININMTQGSPFSTGLVAATMGIMGLAMILSMLAAGFAFWRRRRRRQGQARALDLQEYDLGVDYGQNPPEHLDKK